MDPVWIRIRPDLKKLDPVWIWIRPDPAIYRILPVSVILFDSHATHEHRAYRGHPILILTVSDHPWKTESDAHLLNYLQNLLPSYPHFDSDLANGTELIVLAVMLLLICMCWSQI